MGTFVGRTRELQSLRRQLELVTNRASGEPSGRCLFVRGRRRVGKSRLLETFCGLADIPSLFFTATHSGARELEHFTEEVLASTLPGKDVFAESHPSSWDAALRLLAAALDDTTPAIVVIDEFPYLVQGDPSLEGVVQKHWDRLLSKKPVLLVLIGSDMAMMETLNTYGRPLYQRGIDMVVAPLSPVETSQIVGAPSAVDAFDAYLMTGGLPLICDEWPSGRTMWDYLTEAVHEPTSALVVSAERVLAAEFPSDTQARTVLGQIGTGETTFKNIARAMGQIPDASTNRSLKVLTAKGVVAKDTPLSTRKSSESRYRVADPYLRFWLRFIGPHMAEIERGRGDRVLERVRRDWATWRGRAIEPVIREALSRLSPVAGLPRADAVGGFWTRTNRPEIDIIGADAHPLATTISYAGTVKWLDREPLTQADVNRLIRDVASVPGAPSDLPLVAVSRSGVRAQGVTALGPDDLIKAW